MGLNTATDLMKSAGDLFKTVPEIYKDGAQETVKSTGGLMAILPRAIRAALSDVEKRIIDKEYSVEAYRVTQELMLQQLRGTPPEKIVAPEFYIAAPAVQAISMSIDNVAIRDMYAKLLARAVVIDTKDSVHPAYVECIKRMSPRDASNLSIFPTSVEDTFPVAKYTMGYADKVGYTEPYANIFLANPKYSDIVQQAISISLLISIGLIEIDYKSYCPKPNAYDGFVLTNEYLALKRKSDSIKLAEQRDVKLDLVRGMVQLTPLGCAFKKVCLE